MVKKLLYIFLMLIIISIVILNTCHALDMAANLDSSNTTTENSTQTIADDTIYSENITDTEVENTFTEFDQSTVTTTADYEDEAELSISNIINIILISVGIVLILLGIAIIIKLK